MTELKTCYGLADLAKLAGMTRRRVERLLLANGVPLKPSGEGRRKRRRVVMLSDLKETFPEFWRSVEARRQGRE